jgi:ketosteroid isomerase-like protein
MVCGCPDRTDAALERFYQAFAAGDGAAMAAAYTPDATFSDPVFVGLKGDEPGAMWRMLTGQARGFHLDLLEHSAEGDLGTARWRAAYTFSQTGRPVVNVVDSAFVFRDGLIVEQRDDFDFYRWSRQALGPVGLLLGWSPILRGSVQKRARASLDRFMAG